MIQFKLKGVDFLNINDEFMNIAGEIIKHPEMQRLKCYTHHIGTTRFDHSVKVANLSYKIAKFLNLDYVSALRGALFHDLFFYDYREEGMGILKHSSHHPKIALKNALEICELNKIEKDIILKHMWLADYKFPRYKESYVVTFADKICAVYEVFRGIKRKRFIENNEMFI